MRVLGVFMFLFGCTATAYSVWATYHRKRPRDVLFAVLAPLVMLVALVGLLLVFVPGFFG